MDWIVGMQKAIDYIEEHLDEELNYEEAAKEAACSVFYFQRIFGILCGMSLGEYIRGRRLTLAGSELLLTHHKVVDIALKYGYESQESFTRAFSKYHGITPAAARRSGAKLRSLSRLSVQIILKGGSHMHYKIVQKPSFHVLERVEIHSIAEGENKNTIPAFWERAHGDGTVETLLKSSCDKRFLFGICYGNIPVDSKTFEYAIAAECEKDCAVPDGFRKSVIPERTWVVFECVGAMPDAMQETWHKICSEFIPTSGFQPTYEMDIEAYPGGEMNSPAYRSEIWLPVATA